MKLLLGTLLWVSAGAVFPSSLQPPFPTWAAEDGYEAVLRPDVPPPLLPRCTLIVFTDDATSSLAFQQLWSAGKEKSGGAVFAMETSKEHGTNYTQTLIPWVARARQLRKLSWCVTVVVVSDDSAFLAAFGEVSDKSRLIVWETRLLVVTRLDEESLRGLFTYWNFSMMNAMTLKLKSSSVRQGWDAYVYLPYTPNGAQVVRVASWKRNYGLLPSDDYKLFPEKYKNFHGARVNMTVFPFAPYWMEANSFPEEDANESHGSKITGRDYIILENIAQGLNFSINVLPYGEWDEVMMRLEVRTALMSPLKLAILPNLVNKYDFSFFIERATLGFSMSKPTLKPSWQSLYYPLQTEVWVSILATVLMVFSALLLMMKHSGESESYRVWLVVKQVVGTLLVETIAGELPQRSPTRVVLAAWFIFAFIVGNVYRGNLTASLTVPKYPARAETLAQLVDAGALLTTPPDAVDFINNFKQSDSKLFQTVAERTSFVPSYEIGMKESLKNNKAYLYERLNMKLMIAEHYTGKGGSTPLYVAKQNILPSYCGWPLAPNTPFKANLDQYILAFHGAGLIGRWTTEILERAQFNSQQRQRQVAEESSVSTEKDESAGDRVNRALTLVHMQGPLFLFLAGTLLSLAAFLGEITVTLCHMDR
ncbi:uncharacterized protein LOC127007030 [Eriocheir sinensis]|uniref:uncharacterized protein LOC127007030 n=1 Tax=Eriocheir sinensis TaxID=95602 RepID=UPI0021C7B2FE|nr:uncharacterized protein LOC127007030 [Eriocheir sinensis]